MTSEQTEQELAERAGRVVMTYLLDRGVVAITGWTDEWEPAELAAEAVVAATQATVLLAGVASVEQLTGSVPESTLDKSEALLRTAMAGAAETRLEQFLAVIGGMVDGIVRAHRPLVDAVRAVLWAQPDLDEAQLWPVMQEAEERLVRANAAAVAATAVVHHLFDQAVRSVTLELHPVDLWSMSCLARSIPRMCRGRAM